MRTFAIIMTDANELVADIHSHAADPSSRLACYACRR